jgi:hypothetical protein
MSTLAAAAVWTGAHFATRHHAPLAGLVIDLGGLFLIGVLAMWVARAGVPGFPLQRSRSVNLVAVPPNSVSRPEIWLSAHIDSKSQTIPMIVRVASTVVFAVLSAAVALAIIVMLFMPNLSSTIAGATIVLSWLAVVAALPIILCFIADRSTGALDNASGVASVILAAELITGTGNVGVVITSGEELGLAGARHFAAIESNGKIAINCDTIDDDGSFRCMSSGLHPKRLNDAIGRASRGSLHLTPMIPGIIADNVAFTAEGWESFTLSRGNISTLGYVHTSGDTSDRLKGTGIAQASSLIAAIVQELA